MLLCTCTHVVHSTHIVSLCYVPADVVNMYWAVLSEYMHVYMSLREFRAYTGWWIKWLHPARVFTHTCTYT